MSLGGALSCYFQVLKVGNRFKSPRLLYRGDILLLLTELKTGVQEGTRLIPGRGLILAQEGVATGGIREAGRGLRPV